MNTIEGSFSWEQMTLKLILFLSTLNPDSEGTLLPTSDFASYPPHQWHVLSYFNSYISSLHSLDAHECQEKGTLVASWPSNHSSAWKYYHNATEVCTLVILIITYSSKIIF